jgi:hypothetical protein
MFRLAVEQRKFASRSYLLSVVECWALRWTIHVAEMTDVENAYASICDGKASWETTNRSGR